jgi:hypothetical protein
MNWSLATWWKVECLSCGINADLLKDKIGRIICKECLDKYELTEVENELHAHQISTLGTEDTGESVLRKEQERVSETTRRMD